MDAGHINISDMDLMAARRSLTLVCFVLCILISTRSLKADTTDKSQRHGTCAVEKGEDHGFCDSENENMYLENVDISDLKETETSLQNKEGVEISSEDSPVEKTSSENGNSLFDRKDENVDFESVEMSDLKDTGASLPTKDNVVISLEGSLLEEPSSEDGNSLLEINDTQIHDINNSTNEWLGLQIPVVDGVRVSDPFFLP